MKVVKSLYFQILCAVVLGIVVGHFWAQQAIALKPLGDAFIKLIKMMIAPVVFCTIVTGIAGMSDKRSLGRLLGKTMLLFFVLTVISLLIGLVAVYVFQPGAGMNIDPTQLSTKGLAQYTESAAKLGVVEFSCTSFPRLLSAPSVKVRCCRCCLLRCCPALPCRRWASVANRYSTCSNPPRKWSSRSFLT